MTFIEAIHQAVEAPKPCKVFRENGPTFRIDDLGEMMQQHDGFICYLGDVLDLEDWHVETIPSRKEILR